MPSVCGSTPWELRASCGASSSPRDSSGPHCSICSCRSRWSDTCRRVDPISVVGCMALTVSVLFFIVYDSLESPLFILMLAIGLMNRQRLDDQDRNAQPATPSRCALM